MLTKVGSSLIIMYIKGFFFGVVVLAHVTADVCFRWTEEIEICLPSESILTLIYCLLLVPLKNRCLFKALYSNCVVFHEASWR